MGLIDSLKIWRDNFAFRSSYIHFIDAFVDLFFISGYQPETIKEMSLDSIKKIIIEILSNLDLLEEGQILFGKSMIFLKRNLKIRIE